jgi:hypothetical protein
VHDRTVGPVVAAALPSFERLDQKVDNTLRVIRNEVWRDARIVPLCTENGLRFSAHLGSGEPEVRFERIV